MFQSTFNKLLIKALAKNLELEITVESQYYPTFQTSTCIIIIMSSVLHLVILFLKTFFRVENKEREVKMANQVGQNFEKGFIYLLVFCFFKRVYFNFLASCKPFKILWRLELNMKRIVYSNNDWSVKTERIENSLSCSWWV